MDAPAEYSKTILNHLDCAFNVNSVHWEVPPCYMLLSCIGFARCLCQSDAVSSITEITVMVESRSMRRSAVQRCAASWRCAHPAHQRRDQDSGVEKETILWQERPVSRQTAANDRETELNG